MLADARDEPPARLRISADPDAPRIHLQHERVPRHEGPLGPFFRQLAVELADAELTSLAQVANDRAVILEFAHGAAGARRALIVELFGRRANLVLVGPEDRVIDMLVPSRSAAGPARLAPGEIWRRPPGTGADPEPTRLAATFPPPTAPPPRASISAPLSWIVESSLGAQAREALHARALTRLEERLQRKLKRARTLVTGLEHKLTASTEFERVRRDGELLKAHLHVARRGLSSIEVPDLFEEGAPLRTIELEPRASPQENLTRLFDRAKKLERARRVVESELAIARARIDALTEYVARAHARESDPAALDDEAVAAGLLDPLQEADARKRKQPTPRLPYRVFHSQRGTEIRVGRSARDNDDLTFRAARGNDVWLHTADAPGSHVVLKVGRDEPDAEDVLDAAHLAVHFSPLRGGGGAGVHVARVKDVKKPRGAKPGLVSVAGGKVLRVRVETARLEKLLGTQRHTGDTGE